MLRSGRGGGGHRARALGAIGARSARHPARLDRCCNKTPAHRCHIICIYIDVFEPLSITTIMCLVDTSKKTGTLAGRVADRDAPELVITSKLLQHALRG